jgi:site-specific recombinase XerD
MRSAMTPGPAHAVAVLTDDLAAARTYASADKAAGTKRAYRSDFEIFKAYCLSHGQPSLPAGPAITAAFVSSEAQRGISASTISRRIASIRYAHKLAGHETPTDSEAVKSVVRGIRRTHGTAPIKKAPATADIVTELLAHCPDTLRGKRDRALLALGFAGAFRRSELVELRVADLVEAPDGFRVLIRHSKTDQESAGQQISIPHGTKMRPVEAVRAWLSAAGIVEGPVFRPINRGGRVVDAMLTAESAAQVVKDAAERAGLDPRTFAGHSLRAGFLTSAASAGASIFKMMDQSRHKSVETLRGYVRDADTFNNHAGKDFL